MRTERSFLAAVGGIVLTVVLRPIVAQETEAEWRRLTKASESELAAWVNVHLQAGMPPSDVFGMVTLNRSEVVLPLIEQKIEEVLQSPAPLELFSDKSIDPQKFVHSAALSIAANGDVQALKEASKLIKIDEKQFGWMVEDVLLSARTYRNPFTLAYRGFELGDPAIDSRIAAWAEVDLADKRPPLRNYGPRDPEPVPESEIRRVREWLAAAMVEKYGWAPTESQWTHDPIVSRLAAIRTAAIHDDVMRLAAGAAQKGPQRR
jgi:hypothetical protein